MFLCLLVLQAHITTLILIGLVGIILLPYAFAENEYHATSEGGGWAAD